jgi:multidrug efflux pump subunit AcrB
MLIGLLAKNAILIVEFAVARNKQGYDIIPAAIEGARQRLRPILMTSFAFVAGLFHYALHQELEPSVTVPLVRQQQEECL